jgi:hypothetical protein
LRAGAAEAQVPKPVVRLGRVRSASYLRERIAHRESVCEIGFYDDRHWTERPEFHVRRELARKMFQERGLRAAWTLPCGSPRTRAPDLERGRRSAGRAPRVELRYQLQSELAVLDEQTITVDRAIVGDSFESFVATTSKALGKATDRIADAVARATPSAFTPACGKGPARIESRW